MQDKFTTFFNQNNNQSVEKEDSTALDQCMDLIFAWCDLFGIPREAVRHQYAYQVWANPTDVTRQYFDLIPNTTTNVPQIGDIIVFKQINGIPVGHVSLETGKSDVNNLISFDENWDTLHYYHTDAQGNHIPYCRVVVHPQYYGVAGFLRPKNIVVTPGEDVLVNEIQAVINSSDDPHTKITKIKGILH